MFDHRDRAYRRAPFTISDGRRAGEGNARPPCADSFRLRRLLGASAMLLMFGSPGQGADRLAAHVPNVRTADLSTYVIEREIPGAGKLSADELRAIARKSRDVLENLGPGIRWIHSYVVDDKIYCVYAAQDQDIIRRHAEWGGFPVSRISRVHNVISLETAEHGPSSPLLYEALPLPLP